MLGLNFEYIDCFLWRECEVSHGPQPNHRGDVPPEYAMCQVMQENSSMTVSQRASDVCWG
jgi:hypothetical protein